MHLMIESGIRGGMSVVTHKHAKANNPYVEGYDPSKPTSYCMYLDANNLYGWAMSQKMPYDNHCWMTSDELERFNVMNIPDDADEGYILEVDLDYPHEIHSHHNDLPLAPENRKVMKEEWSPYTKELAERFHYTNPTQKLISDLHNKRNYVVHYRNLKLYLRLGLQLVKIHRGISFSQSYWLRDYIQLNTEKRKLAKNSFEKDFFKLMNNSVFGKTMENVRKRIDLKLVNDKSKLAKLTKRNQFVKTRIITPDLVSVQSKVTKVKLDKPIYIGFCILDVSKVLMYEFHYDIIKTKYQERAILCFTDTDSLLYYVETEDIYKDMAESQDLYDTSDYPIDHFLHSTANKKVLGKMKDENAGTPIAEFVGLRSKMYSLKTATGVEKKTAKGINKATIRKNMRHDSYSDCLWSGKRTIECVRTIRSKNHKVFSLCQQKVALSSFDDKRFVLENKYETRAHGHFLNFI